MLRFINANIFIGLAHEAVLGYIMAGKRCPQTMDEVETLMLTVMDRKELERLGKIPGIEEAMTQITIWMMADEPTRSWFADCELGQMFEDAKRVQVTMLSGDEIQERGLEWARRH